MVLPQLWVLWRTRKADDLSHGFLLLFNAGLLLLGLYNVFLGLTVYIIAGFMQLRE